MVLMFDPSEPTEEELLWAQHVPLKELRDRAQRIMAKLGDPIQDVDGLIRAAHAEKLYRYEIHRRRESL